MVQKGISWLPAAHRVNFLFQKHITKGVCLSDGYFQDKLDHAFDHLRFYEKHRGGAPKRTLELGTGWYPIVPVCMYLAGAKQAVSVDLNDLMRTDALRETLYAFQQALAAGQLERFRPFWQKKQLKALEALPVEAHSRAELLQFLHLELLITDARNLPFGDGHFDLVHSNNTFEHIYPAVLSAIMREFKRVTKSKGLNSHFIDLSDHFAHLDDSISIYNFLRFSDRQWRLIDNSVQPQNRLRISDYEKLYRELGCAIIDKEYRPGEPEALHKLNLAPPFDAYNEEELAVSHAHLINQQ